MSNHNSNIKCPDWAKTMLKQLRDYEIDLGNLLPSDKEYLTKSVANLDENLDVTEHEVERIFLEIVRGLASQNYDVQQIADWINQGMCPDGGMPYCNVNEVEDVLK